RQKKELTGFDSQALQAIMAYHWPGNIRELENVIERAVTLESGNQIEFSSLPPHVTEDFNSGKKGFVSPSPNAQSPLGTPQAGSLTAGIRLPQPDFSKGSIQLD